MATSGMRTKKGNVTAKARQKSGMNNARKSFPVFDEKSAMSAIKLRHNGKGVSAASVLSKVASWASKNGKSSILKAVAAAREADKSK